MGRRRNKSVSAPSAAPAKSPGAGWSVETMREMVGRVFDHTRASWAMGDHQGDFPTLAGSNTMDFRRVRDVGINEILVNVLPELRAQCRYEMRQNGLAKGQPRVYANGCVGRGPNLSIDGSDAALAWGDKEVEPGWAAWAAHSGQNGESLGMLLGLGVEEFYPNGEFIWVANPTEEEPNRELHPAEWIRLRLQAIRPDRLQTPSGADPQKIVNGLELDRYGRVLRYWFLKYDPDNVPGGNYPVNDFLPVSADKVIHVFRRETAAQHRGVPWSGVTLATFHRLRRFDEATIAAAIVAAKFAAVLVNKSSDALAAAAELEVAKILPPKVMEIADGMVIVPPVGYEIQQIQPEHPGANASDFRRDQLAVATMANAMPPDIATGDTSRSNFASIRFGGQTLVQDFDVIRGALDVQAMNRVFGWWLREARALGVVSPPPKGKLWHCKWRWPVESRHTDQIKTSTARQIDLECGAKTYADVWGEQGYDVGAMRRRMLADIQWCRENDVYHPRDNRMRRETTPAAGGRVREEEEAGPEDAEKGGASHA